MSPATAPDPAPLEELLRRCHRAELLPLAEVVGVRPDGMGLAALASAVGRTLRRRGAQDVWNAMFRKGEGPPYAEVVRALAERKGVEPAASTEQTEAALLAWWLQDAVDSLSPADRARVQARLDVALPDGGPGPLLSLRERLRLGARWGLGATALSALRFGPLLFPPLLPLAGMAGVFWLGRPRDALLLPAVLEVHALRRAVRHRVTVGVVGSPSSGKDAAIRAIFGIDSGNIDPVAGSTRAVEITQIKGSTALYLVNTPGMGDVIASVTEEARQVLDLIDVFVYVLNSQGGVQARELDDYRRCLARERPVLVVVNKIDTLKPEDRERYLDDARAKLGAAEGDFLAAAFDPLPQLAPGPIGVEPVRAWIAERLEGLGKDPSELPWAGEPSPDNRGA